MTSRIGLMSKHPLLVVLLPLVAVILLTVPKPSEEDRTRTPFLFTASWRSALVERYRAVGIGEEQLPLLAALTLGYKEDLSRDTRRAFQRSGAAHILAVSGLHTGLVAGMVMTLLTLGGRYKPLYHEQGKRIRNSLVLALSIWLYVALTGFTPSVVRSAIMVSTGALAYSCYRQPIGINTLLLSAILILLFRPSDLYSISFQLSFAAVGMILLLYPMMPRFVHGSKGIPTPLQKGILYLRDLVPISLAAQLGVLPLTLYYFHQTSNIFLFTNMIVLPLAQIAVWLAVGVLIAGSIPYAGPLFVWTENGIVRLMQLSTGWIENLPGAVTERSIQLWQVGLLYIIIGLFLLLLYRIKQPTQHEDLLLDRAL